VYLGDTNNERQPEMVTETGNTYISETMAESVEILRASSGFSTDNMYDELDKSAFNLRQRRTAQYSEIVTQNAYIAISCCRSLSQSPGDSFFRARRGRKPQICRSNFDIICHSSRDISTSGFRSYIAISGCRSLLQSSIQTLSMVVNPRFVIEILIKSFKFSEI